MMNLHISHDRIPSEIAFEGLPFRIRRFVNSHQGEKPFMTQTSLRLTLRDVLLLSAERWPDRPALCAAVPSLYTYTHLLTEAAAWSSWFLALKLQKGDRIAVHPDSRTEWTSALFGIAAAGFIAVSIPPDFSPYQVSRILDQNDVKAALSSGDLDKNMEKAVSLGQRIQQDLPRALLDNRYITGGIGKGTFLGEPGNPLRMFEETLVPDDFAFIFYPAHKTENPVGINFTHNAVIRDASSELQKKIGLNIEDIRLLSQASLAQ